MKSSRIKELNVLAESKFLSLYDAKYENKNGNEKHWMISSRKTKEALEGQYFNNEEEKIDAVVLVPYHKTKEKLVLIKQFRVPLNDYVYELPAGLIDNEEDIHVTASRELKEETGLKVEEIIEEKIGQQLYLSPGMTDESVSLVYCTCSGEVSKQYLEEDEDIETILVSSEEAKELLKENVKFDIKCFIILGNFANIGKEIFE